MNVVKMNHSMVLQVLAGMVNINKEEDGVSLKEIKSTDSFIFSAGCQ